MDNARSLDPSCVNHELIKSKPAGTRGARVLSRIFAKTRQAPWAIAAKNDEPSAVRVGIAGNSSAIPVMEELPTIREPASFTHGLAGTVELVKGPVTASSAL
jgi:hypothetical protein